MILLTGATGLVGSHVLRALTSAGQPVRVLARDARRLGNDRVRVQIALGDLGDAASYRHALRGVETVLHMAGAARDQASGTVEELNGVATWRLAQAARRAGVRHFVYLSVLGATYWHPARFFRAKALGERALRESGIPHTVLRCSLVYAPGDQWQTAVSRLALLPVVPLPGLGRVRYQPLWARDAAACVLAVANQAPTGGERLELAGPETLDQRDVIALALRAQHRRRVVLPVPWAFLSWTLRAQARLPGPPLVRREELELVRHDLLTPRGTADAETLDVEPARMADVLGAN